ncbi:MAG: type II secretion system F family protein [Planctomycetes bacterium]|nr:type II secretion system F family protein [Planctomycetota bacterium]
MRFRSTILETDGSQSQTVIEADDEQSLHARLHDEGRTLLRVQPVDRVEAEKKGPGDVRMAPRRLLLLTQALYEALDAGVPLLGTFQAVAEQEEDPRIAALLDDLGDRVAAGQPLSEAMAVYPGSFPGIYCALVRAGEQSGSLPEVLQSITGFLEWRLEIAGTVKQAMVYPMVVAAAGYGMVVFMLAFVIPRLGAVLSKMGGDLPAASRMLIGASGFVAANVGYILGGTVLAAIGFKMALRTPAFSGMLLNLLGKLPVVRDLVGTLAVAQFARTFSVLLHAGLTMTSALELGSAAVSLPRVRDRLDGARERILAGARLGEAFKEEEVLPPVALSMVLVGEEAGRLPVTFERLSKLYDREVKAAVKKALGLLEPAVTVLLGIVVGGVAVLVVGTIYSAMKGIGK